MRKPRVLVIHNQYQLRGGEDAVVGAEVDLLRNAGHAVVEFTRSNAEIASYAPLRKAALAVGATWSGTSYRQLRMLIHNQRPDLAHCHNLVPLISPAAYYACRDAGIPVVQTLHNYRLLCPAGTSFRAGQDCAECGPSFAIGIARGCYRSSRAQTAVVAGMIAFHRLRGTWRNLVQAYISVSHNLRNRLAPSILPAEKVWVKPNFLARDPGRRSGDGDYAIYAGRLSAEKGVLEMLKAWRQLPQIPLVVVGDGPLYFQAQQMAVASGLRHIRLLGQRSPAETLAIIKGARFLVFPSRWSEPFGMTLLEAAACGVPAVASRVGAVPEIVIHGETGLLYDAEHPDELAAQAGWAWEHPDDLRVMGYAARRRYLEQYSAESNYDRLMGVYSSALGSRVRRLAMPEIVSPVQQPGLSSN